MQTMAEKSTERDQTWICHFKLPDLLSRGELDGVAYFVSSKVDTVHFQAVQLLGWTLLDQHTNLSMEKLVKVEQVLWKQLERRALAPESQQPTLLDTRDFLSAVYMLLVTVMMLKAAEGGQDKDIKLFFLEKRKLAVSEQTKSEMGKSESAVLFALKTCFEAWRSNYNKFKKARGKATAAGEMWKAAKKWPLTSSLKFSILVVSFIDVRSGLIN
jgi:hypothetical protein